MRFSSLLVFLLPAAAQAEPRSGLYIGANLSAHYERASYDYAGTTLDGRPLLDSASSAGPGAGLSVAAGYGVSDNFALAIDAGLLGNWGKSSGLQYTGWDSAMGAQIGVLADWFIDKSWHIEGGAGWMTRGLMARGLLIATPDNNVDVGSPSGPYLRFGAGYQMMVNRSFGLGPLVRLEAAYATTKEAVYVPLSVSLGLNAIYF
jgi:hypothetical protein